MSEEFIKSGINKLTAKEQAKDLVNIFYQSLSIDSDTNSHKEQMWNYAKMAANGTTTLVIFEILMFDKDQKNEVCQHWTEEQRKVVCQHWKDIKKEIKLL
jgi:hypothetical protein